MIEFLEEYGWTIITAIAALLGLSFVLGWVTGADSGLVRLVLLYVEGLM